MLKIIWFVPPAVHLVAESRGYLQERGIAMQTRLTHSSDEQLEGLREGRYDAAVTAMDNVILWNRRAEGPGYLVVAQVEATTAISLVAQSKFRAIADLRGARLLVDSARNGFVVALRMLLADAGVEFDACEVVEAGGVKERFSGLLASKGDATLLGPPFVGLAGARGLRRLADVDAAYPGFPGQGIVVRADLAGEQHTELLRWLQALELARVASRRDAAGAAADLGATGLDSATAAAMIAATAETLVPDRTGVEMLIHHRERLGLPGGDDGYADVVDLEMLVAALDGHGGEPAIQTRRTE